MANIINTLDTIEKLTKNQFPDFTFAKSSLNNQSINQTTVSEFLNYLCNGFYQIEDKEFFKKIITDTQFKNIFNFNELLSKLLNYNINNNSTKEELIHFFLSNRYISKQITVDNNFNIFCAYNENPQLLKKLLKKVKSFNVIQSGFDSALSCSNEVVLKVLWKNKEYREKINFINNPLSVIVLQFPYENHFLFKLNKICDTTPYIQSSFNRIPHLLVDCWNHNFSDINYINHLILNKKIILSENMENELFTDNKDITFFFHKYDLNLKLHDKFIVYRPDKKLKI